MATALRVPPAQLPSTGAMFNPFGFLGKKRDAAPSAADEAKEAALAEKAAMVKKEAEMDVASRTLERQLRSLKVRVDDTLKKMDLLEKKRDSEVALMAAAAKSGSEARKKMHFRNKKRADDEIKSLTAHMSQLEDMRTACEKRLSQLERQDDLKTATEALGKAKIDVEEVENVMEEAKMGVENVGDVEMVMNGFQLDDNVIQDDEEMERELREYEEKEAAKKAALSEEEVGKLVEPEVPEVLPPKEVVEADELKRLEKEIAM